ncbi:retrovirus-related pol polyprotein from transposon TNT 1-94 [Tanacetum coccineum]
MNEDTVKKDLEEIETINIELDHMVSKLIAENEHLKQTYMQLYDSIKPTRIRSKEQCDGLINQVNLKSTEIFNLNARLQEKVLVITALKYELRKLKGKALVDNAVMKHTIDSEMLKNEFIRNVTISRVYYVEGLGHNLFSVGKFYDSNLEVAFRQHTCFIHNLEGLLKLKFEKDHLCSACAMGKSKKKPHKPKSEDTNQEKLYLLHMDLCGPMRVASVNGKKYILVIVDDYTQFTWVKCLRSKDEAPNFIIKFLKMIQVRLQVPVRRIKTDNGTEFVNQTLRDYYEKVVISHETSVARSPQQNGVVERCNHTLIEVSRTILIYAKALLFLWAKAVATACYTQNRSIVRLRHGKTPYVLLHEKLPDLSFFHVFGALCYPTNDSENLSKLQPKADIGVFIGYAPTKKAFRIYNRRTRRIIKTIHVDFDELTVMASKHSSSGPALHDMTPATIILGLVPNPPPSTPFVPPLRISPVLSVSTGSPSSTIVDQDAPSPTNSQTTPKTQSPILPNDVEEDNHDLDVAHMNNDPFFGITIPENDSEASSSDVIPTVVQTAAPNSEHVTKWTKDHPLDNIIGELERPVSTRLQLHEQALFCYYDAFLTSVKPKNYKDALTQACWIEAMQEELHEFDRLEVWELVPRPDKVMIITLKWIYKVKLDEMGGILKNKARLEFFKGTVDLTLFIRRQGKDILLVQIYVDDIIFASTTPELCDQFSKIMCSKFNMSMMGKISFFLRLQISQSPRGIFLNQSKYALESLKKYGMESSDPVDTPMVEKSKLDEDPQGKTVDPTHYRGMVI